MLEATLLESAGLATADCAAVAAAFCAGRGFVPTAAVLSLFPEWGTPVRALVAADGLFDAVHVAIRGVVAKGCAYECLSAALPGRKRGWARPRATPRCGTSSRLRGGRRAAERRDLGRLRQRQVRCGVWRVPRLSGGCPTLTP